MTYLAWRRDPSDGFDILRALPALRPRLDLEGKKLPHLRPTDSWTECPDVHKDLLTPLGRLDESEAAIVIPGLERAFEAQE